VPQNLLGATPSIASEAVACQADIIITMVPNTPDVEQVLFGANGVAAGRQRQTGH
jgi:2-hydroxy-3-oxopropionate reductase